jgi:hypothetical protein
MSLQVAGGHGRRPRAGDRKDIAAAGWQASPPGVLIPGPATTGWGAKYANDLVAKAESAYSNGNVFGGPYQDTAYPLQLLHFSNFIGVGGRAKSGRCKNSTFLASWK